MGRDLRAADRLPAPLRKPSRRSTPVRARASSLDGNGRAGRLVLNLMLVRLGYPPVVIFKRQRDAYLAAMRKADEADFGPLRELIARAMLDNLNLFIVPSIAGPARLVPLASLADKTFSVCRPPPGVAAEYKRTRHRRRPPAGQDAE